LNSPQDDTLRAEVIEGSTVRSGFGDGNNNNNNDNNNNSINNNNSSFYSNRLQNNLGQTDGASETASTPWMIPSLNSSFSPLEPLQQRQPPPEQGLFYPPLIQPTLLSSINNPSAYLPPFVSPSYYHTPPPQLPPLQQFQYYLPNTIPTVTPFPILQPPQPLPPPLAAPLPPLPPLPPQQQGYLAQYLQQQQINQERDREWMEFCRVIQQNLQQLPIVSLGNNTQKAVDELNLSPNNLVLLKTQQTGPARETTFQQQPFRTTVNNNSTINSVINIEDDSNNNNNNNNSATSSTDCQGSFFRIREPLQEYQRKCYSAENRISCLRLSQC